MLLPTATLEYPPATPADDGPDGSLSPPRARPAKFHYASGSRPLEGYTIKRGIGRGGFGEVYFALSDAGKEVALKRIERNLEVELRGVSQCLNLRHQNLIELYDIRQDDNGESWVVMEYIAGPSLKEVLDRNPIGLTPDEVLFWFGGLAAGVSCLHDHGIVHRDLKPANLFDDGGVVKVGDYGLCKFISHGKKSGQTESVGTCHYMAPEIGKGDYGKEIDIYSLGIVLFEMLTGRLPFDGESSQEIMMKHLTADPDLSAVPEAFRSVIARALRKDSQQRFANVHDLLVAVERAMEPPVEVDGPLAEIPLALPAAASAANASADAASVHVISPAPEPYFIGETDEPEILLGPVKPGPGKPLKTTAPARPQNHRPLPGRPAVLPMAAAGTAVLARPPAEQEPIAQAIKSACSGFVNWLNHGRGGTLLKAIVLLAGVTGFVLASPWLIPAGMVLGALYLVYLGIRLMTQAASGVRIEPEVAMSPSGRQRRLSPEQQCRQWLGLKTASDKLMELSGSMLGATAVTAILGVVMLVIAGKPLDMSIDTWTLYAWLMLTSTLCAWTVLAAGKLWETSAGEQMKRRFVLLVLGLALGAVAYGLQQLLFVPLTDQWSTMNLQFFKQPANMLAGSQPLLPMFLVYFGGLLPLVGWWKQTDPLRESRLAVWPIIVTAVAAWLWYAVWQFPQPWGFMIGVMVSAAVQLSAPWLNPAARTQIRERAALSSSS
jgi:serine/threonine protein kinase